MSLNNQELKRSRKSFNDEGLVQKKKRSNSDSVNTMTNSIMVPRGDMVAHLLKGFQNNVVQHEQETSYFQKLNIHWIGERILELWVAWDDGEMDFIFPENQDLMFEDQLQQIWENWGDYTNPLEVWMEKFLLVYSESLRVNAVLSVWQEKSLNTLASCRNKNYNVVGRKVIISAQAMINEFSRGILPSLEFSLKIAISPTRYISRGTKVKVTCDTHEIEHLRRLSITDGSLTEVLSTYLTKQNKAAGRSSPARLEAVLTSFEKLINERIKREYEHNRWFMELHVALISQFGFDTLGEILGIHSAKKKESVRTWHFLIKLQLDDFGDIVIPYNVEVQWSIRAKTVGKLHVNVATMKTIAHILGHKSKEFEIVQEDIDGGFHDLAKKARTWVRVFISNNNIIRDGIEYLYKDIPDKLSPSHHESTS